MKHGKKHAAPADPVPATPELLEKAAACLHKHACLCLKTRNVCKVVDTSGPSVFVRSDGRECPFLRPFGVSHKLCTCPVRQFLHESHGI